MALVEVREISGFQTFDDRRSIPLTGDLDIYQRVTSPLEWRHLAASCYGVEPGNYSDSGVLGIVIDKKDFYMYGIEQLSRFIFEERETDTLITIMRGGIFNGEEFMFTIEFIKINTTWTSSYCFSPLVTDYAYIDLDEKNSWQIRYPEGVDDKNNIATRVEDFLENLYYELFFTLPSVPTNSLN